MVAGAEFVPMGDSAWRLALPPGTDPAAALSLLRGLPRVLDVVVADGHALIRFAPGAPPDDPRQALGSLAGAPRAERRLHVVQARYDGPDIEEVARSAGVAASEVARLHAGREYTVEMIGFLPGFAYLGPVDARLMVPRCASPRLRVPAGAIGLAAGRTGIYPLASPGGWQLIGSAVSFRAFDPARGALLALGDRVRFEPLP